ncbi:MAG: hypothetical protein HY815_00070 [Candidatus Riflebacteria bacterium]|nr:hypothetical protein [Candidatus Riflebacteria bacterium]
MRCTCAVGMAVIGATWAGLAAGQPMPTGNPFVESDSITELRSFVTKINLLNGLGMTLSQLAKVRRILTEADDARQVALVAQKRYEAICVPEFERLRSIVWDGTPLASDVYERCKALDDGNRLLQNAYLRSLAPLEEKLRIVLTPAQRSLVDRHADCMVPAPNLQDPERIGQAGNGFAYVALLKEIRKLPEAEFQARKNEYSALLIQGVEGDFGLVGRKEMPALVKRCDDVVEEARKLPDVRFALRVGKMAEEMDPQIQDIRLKNLRVENDLDVVGGLGKVGRILLDVRLLPVVADRIKKLQAQTAQTGSSNLLKGPGPVAESCTKGRCAVGTLK